MSSLMLSVHQYVSNYLNRVPRMSEFLTSRQVILRIVTIIAVVEFSIMDGFIFFNADFSPYEEALIDIALLGVLATPLIYLWVINPYISARDSALDEMEKLIYKDLLTGLSNRHDVYSQLETAMSDAAKYAFEGAILLVDLDGLKPVNELCGHDAGDEVLIEIAKRLRSNLKTEDVAGRLDSDEFVIIIKRADRDLQSAHEYAMTLAEQLMHAVTEPVRINDQALHVSARIGIKVFGKESTGVDRAMLDADIALTRAKQRGDGSIELFEA